MAVKLRLMRMGKKKQPTYRVVAADTRSPRDGRFIEIVGIYDPRQDPSVVRIDNDRAVHWLRHGAQPTERVAKLLKISGAWTDFTGEEPPPAVTVAGSAQAAADAKAAAAAEADAEATEPEAPDAEATDTEAAAESTDDTEPDASAVSEEVADAAAGAEVDAAPEAAVADEVVSTPDADAPTDSDEAETAETEDDKA